MKAVTAGDLDITIATKLYSISQTAAQLIEVDQVTGTSGATIPLVLVETDSRTLNSGFGLAVNPADGKLYGLVSITNPSGPTTTRELAAIDPATGVVTPIGATPDFEGIAFSAGGNLWGVKSDTAASGANQPSS